MNEYTDGDGWMYGWIRRWIGNICMSMMMMMGRWMSIVGEVEATD